MVELRGENAQLQTPVQAKKIEILEEVDGKLESIAADPPNQFEVTMNKGLQDFLKSGSHQRLRVQTERNKNRMKNSVSMLRKKKEKEIVTEELGTKLDNHLRSIQLMLQALTASAPAQPTTPPSQPLAPATASPQPIALP